MLFLVEQGDRLHDLSRLAVSALRHSGFDPGFLHGMHRSNAFNRGDVSSRYVLLERVAGPHCLAIHVDWASPAERHSTTEFRSGKMCDVTQVPQKRHIGIA